MSVERNRETDFMQVNSEGHTSSTTTFMPASSNSARESNFLQSGEAWLLRAMFEQATMGIAYASLDGRLVLVNQRYCDIVGYSREELLTGSYQDITHPDDVKANEHYLQEMLTGQAETLSLEKRYLRKDGTVVWASLSISTVSEPSGEAKYFIAFIEDITERKRVEEERARLLALEQLATKRLQALQAITDTALTNLALDDLLHELLVRVREIMVVDNAAILLVNEDGQYLTIRAVLGIEEVVASEVCVPVGGGFAGHIAGHREPLISNDPTKIEIFTPLLREKLRSLLGVPLLIDDRVIGVIHVGTVDARQFTEEDVRLLQRVADRIALAIDRARVYEVEQQVRSEASERANQLLAIFEAMADGVTAYDAKGHLLRANTAARELLGIDVSLVDYNSLSSAERASLYLMRDGNRKSPLAKEQMPLNRILKGEELRGSNTVDVLLQSLSGQELELSVSGMPVRDSGGEITGAVVVFRDVTERRRLERRTHEALKALLAMAEALVDPQVEEEAKMHRRRLQSLVSATRNNEESAVAKRLAELTRNVLNCHRVSITTIEPETTVLRAAAVVGLSPEQEVQWWAEQQHQESRLSDSPTPELVSRLRANEVLQIDMTLPPYNEQPNPYGVQVLLVAPMCVGDQLVGMLTLDNVGARHEYSSEEMALAGAVAKLAGFVIERERLLREREQARANELALREANRRMDEFLGIACHELKTPLAAIKGNVQLAERRLKRLMRQIETPMHQNQMVPDLLENANRQSDRLDRLVTDLLDVSRIQVGKLEMRMGSCDLATIIDETVQEQRLIAPQRTILFEAPPTGTIPIVADADRIGQVLANYLTNALKYSPEESPVEVFMTLEGTMARVAVRDHGQGIPLREQEFIWDRFHRVKGIEVQAGSGVGLGLGLYISKTIIERHRGRVGVESAPGQGSTFWFRLPVVEQLQEA